jgi:hypothetical protein
LFTEDELTHTFIDLNSVFGKTNFDFGLERAILNFWRTENKKHTKTRKNFQIIGILLESSQIRNSCYIITPAANL